MSPFNKLVIKNDTVKKKKKTTQVFAFMEGVHILSFTITLEETIFHDRFAVNFIATANRKYRNF